MSQRKYTFWITRTSRNLFFCKIVGIERFALRAAILHEYQNYLGGGGGAIIPDARPLGTFENQDTRVGKTWYI